MPYLIKYRYTNGRKGHEFPCNSQLIGDGEGGVWVLCNTAGHTDGRRLWHANDAHEWDMCVQLPADSSNWLAVNKL